MNIPKFQTGFMRLCLAIAGCGLVGSVAHATTYTETAEAFRNPMKGFRPSRYIYDQAFSNQEYATVYKDYIPYSSLEASAGDGVQKIKDYADARWAGIETRNIKVIPRVLIVYPGTGEFWPGDIPHDGTAGQWNTDTLKNRLAAMVGKLAQAWDNDPRVAAVRGRGLMLAVACTRDGDGARLMDELRRRGVIALASGDRGECLQLTPPLNIEPELLDEALTRLIAAIQTL